MKIITLPNETKCKLFLQENANWQIAIKEQISQIPEWKNMLMTGGVNAAKNAVQMDDKIPEILYSQLFHQQTQMQKLAEDLQQQQVKLKKNCGLKYADNIESFCMQDILRERIKIIEKTYIDLKCNFLNYLSSRD